MGQQHDLIASKGTEPETEPRIKPPKPKPKVESTKDVGSSSPTKRFEVTTPEGPQIAILANHIALIHGTLAFSNASGIFCAFAQGTWSMVEEVRDAHTQE